MMALPMASAGAWILWSFMAMVMVWGLTLLAANQLAHVQLALLERTDNAIDVQSSFDSIVKHLLGAKWARVNNLCIAFIMMILMYAYTTAGANIISYTIISLHDDVQGLNSSILSLGFAVIIALVVWLGTSVISTITLVLGAFMVIFFGVAAIDILPGFQTPSLLSNEPTFPFVGAAIPVYVTAFACAGLVPTLVRHYSAHPSYVFKSLLLGTLVALFLYLFWLFISLGSVGRQGMFTVLQNGGNIDGLLQALVEKGASSDIKPYLTLFTHAAIVTSFLSVSIGLLHFIQDKLKLSDSNRHKSLAALICFAPPVLGSLIFPYGFVHAIGFAGIFVAFSFFILPGVLALKAKTARYTAWVSVVFGAVVIILKTAAMVKWLPHFS